MLRTAGSSCFICSYTCSPPTRAAFTSAHPHSLLHVLSSSLSLEECIRDVERSIHRRVNSFGLPVVGKRSACRAAGAAGCMTVQVLLQDGVRSRRTRNYPSHAFTFVKALCSYRARARGGHRAPLLLRAARTGAPSGAEESRRV